MRMASVAGNTKAADTSIRARLAIRVPVEWLAAAAAEKTPKATRPAIMTPLRPRRSPMPPPARSSPAKARLGRATLTMVLSTTTRKTDRHRTGRINQRRSWALVASIGGLLVLKVPV